MATTYVATTSGRVLDRETRRQVAKLPATGEGVRLALVVARALTVAAATR